MADFLDEKRREMQERLTELKPLVEEYERLEAAVQALDGVGAQRGGGSTAPRRARASTTSNGGGARGGRGRPRGSGTRGRQALEIVRAQPGVTITEIAEKMGIQQNYLYRVLPGLQKDGMVRKDGRGWHPMDAA